MTTKRNPVLAGRTKDGDKVKQLGLFDDYNRDEAKSQQNRLLAHIISYGGISTVEAREMGIYHPADVVLKLRRKGLRLTTEKVLENGHRIARYRFMTQEEIEEDNHAA